MDYLKFTDFRNNSKKYFDQIEHGKTFIIIRKGKPVAQIIPFKNSSQGWKRENRKIKLKSKKNTLDYISSERNEK
jgi:antitoxin (DNA-binding transcriptional repressor) of toxin-antitoxin stability system